MEETANLAESLAKQGEHQKAIDLASGIIEAVKDKPKGDYTAACILGRCLPVWQQREDLKAEQKEQFIKLQTEQALQYLSKAVMAGFDDLRSLLKDEDLKVLAEHEEMKKVVAKLKEAQDEKR